MANYIRGINYGNFFTIFATNCGYNGVFNSVVNEQIEKKHREIIADVEEHFATLNSVKDLKEQVFDMKEKIDRIYECIIAVK